ncbi:SusD/RagB family nutrient-binding outer membrane lipoprotein [Chitinophaga rhizosphaerae]|uniref:SusD/RagB family nutrient-binding outer membrane lipoprotein n=1 Tax=Chitinophaga rhizosphaerae TaxID=1864947 RepID=UPI000F80A99D|nr:SusD/RagB family nutrient-binding outer membrane lipoprotein [Chitinophaga rhizosphaerae]
MKTISKILISAALIAGLGACKKFDDLQDNPNKPSQSPPDLILTGILIDLRESPWDQSQRENQFWVSNFDYYARQNYNWGAASTRFGVLRNIQKMEEEANRLGGDENKPYLIIAKLLKAWCYYDMTMKFGDVPMSEAMKSGEDNFTPKYDAQKAVFRQCLALLETANSEMHAYITSARRGNFKGDFMMGGKPERWQKLINSARLRVLITLSKHADDADLKVKATFAAILSDLAKNPIMTGNGDNYEVVYNGSIQENRYPTGPYNSGFDRGRNNMGATYLDTLTAYRDPRTFVVAEPVDTAKDNNIPGFETRFSSYKGGRTGDRISDLAAQNSAKVLSYGNTVRYWQSGSGEPCIQLGYPETCFTIAEAIVRGWVPGDAGSWYKKGIEASFAFYGLDANTLNTWYAATAKAQFKGNNNEGLKQILIQKYLAFFMNSGRQAYYQYRRTGIPAFDIGPSNANGGRIPKRWLYPQAEYQTNNEQVKAALQRQFGGTDDINGEMWLIK